MKAILVEYLKQYIRDRYILEIKVWKVIDKKYKYGLKYSLIFLDYKTQKRILMDNHYPKTPHIHIDNLEFSYEFKDIETLFNDFRNLTFQHFGERI